MRIGKYEYAILDLLYKNDNQQWWKEIKEKISGYSKLQWYRLGFDKWHKTNVIHKSLVRSMRTLEKKGLISNRGETRFTRVELTEIGKIAYIKRMKE